MAQQQKKPPMTWLEHDQVHVANPWSSSERSRYVLDDYDEEHLWCSRCGRRVLRPT